MKGKDIWCNRLSFEESSFIFNVRYFKTEVSLFSLDRHLIVRLLKRPKLIEDNCISQKELKTGNIMQDWQGGIDNRITLEDGVTNKFLNNFKITKVIKYFCPKKLQTTQDSREISEGKGIQRY